MTTSGISATARNSLVILTVIAVGATLRSMAGIVSPLLLAVFLGVMIDSFARVIRRYLPGVKPGLAVAIGILVSVVVFSASALFVADNTGTFLIKLRGYEPRLNAMIAAGASHLGVKAPQTIGQIVGQLDPVAYLGTVAQALQGFSSSAVLVLIYLGFILASRRAFDRKTVKLFRNRNDRHEASNVISRVRNGIERYLWIQTVTGALIAVVGGALMLTVRLEDAVFWAFLIFILNFIPIVGAAVGIILPALFALVQFTGYGEALIVSGGLFAITFIVGNILLPRMQGNSLNMDPLVVLASLGFWGSMLGLTGMFLSTPLTVLMMVILAQFEGSRWIAILLSANGDPMSGDKGGHKPGRNIGLAAPQAASAG
jgi:AI-2 transport protein TqsA